jgi:hypothetical protein
VPKKGLMKPVPPATPAACCASVHCASTAASEAVLRWNGPPGCGARGRGGARERAAARRGAQPRTKRGDDAASHRRGDVGERAPHVRRLRALGVHHRVAG